MNKEELLEELAKQTFVMLKPSPIQGIGVFAITNIPKGQRRIFSDDQRDWHKLSKDEISNLPIHSKLLIENYCLYDEENYFVPEYGFKIVDLVIFLNHAEVPNIESIDDGADFIALREIAEGEELFIDYSEIVDN